MDVPTGNVKVTVLTESLNPEQKPLNYSQKAAGMEKGYGKGMAEYNSQMGRGEKKGAAGEGPGLSPEQKEALVKVYVKLPKKYSSEATTPLTYTVGRGSQTKDFDLTD
jgi:hypothetical protein